MQETYNKTVNIILVVADSHGKNIVFVTDSPKSYSINDTEKLITAGELTAVHIVRSRSGLYLRSYPNTIQKDNLEALTLSSYKLFSISNDLNLAPKLPGFKPYWKLYQSNIERYKKNGERIISIDGQPQTTVKHVTEKLIPHRRLILDAAKHFSIDPYLLGAIIIDEISRAAIIEDIADVVLLYFLGVNTSVGLAQVKLETARGLIKAGYYNPNPNDEKFSKEKVGKTSRRYLYTFVVEPKHNIFFAAASIREIVDRWMPFIDISNKPEIVGSVYSQYHKPHSNPEPNDRGLQIAGEFYTLAKKILDSQ